MPSTIRNGVAVNVSRTALRTGALRLARLWIRCLLAVAAISGAGIVSILLGFNTPPQAVPLVTVVRGYPILALVVVGILLAATFGAFEISRAPLSGSPDGDPDLSKGWQLPRMLISTAISTTSTTAFVALLLLVLLRPSWCPSALCPSPKVVVVTNPSAVHDDNLEVYFTALQGSTFMLPGSTAQYTLGNAPDTIAAVRNDQTPPATYRVVLGIHSLQQGRFGMIITHVALVVVNVPPTPRPLNVWDKGSLLNYNSDPFRVAYVGQSVGTAIPAAYVPFPDQDIQLAPGEADAIDLQVVSPLLVDLQFRVQVTYRVANETAEHTLTLPQVFEVVFTDGSNWHLYQWKSGQFVPAT